MMKYFLALMAIVLVSITPSLSQAQSHAFCGERASVVAGLENKYSETPVSIGLATNGAVIEIFASQQGSFTIMITTPKGRSCLVAAGHNWESLMPKLSEYKS